MKFIGIGTLHIERAVTTETAGQSHSYELTIRPRAVTSIVPIKRVLKIHEVDREFGKGVVRMRNGRHYDISDPNSVRPVDSDRFDHIVERWSSYL